MSWHKVCCAPEPEASRPVPPLGHASNPCAMLCRNLLCRAVRRLALRALAQTCPRTCHRSSCSKWWRPTMQTPRWVRDLQWWYHVSGNNLFNSSVVA